MNNMDEAKEFLQQVYKARQICLRCDADLEELRSTFNLLSPSYKEHVGHTNKTNDTSDFMVRIEEQEAELEKLKIEWLNKRNELKNFLMDIKNMSENTRTVMILRYVSLKKWEEIAVRLNKSYGWVHKLKYTGMKIVAEKLKNGIQKETKVYRSR